MNPNRESIGTNTTMLITGSRYSDNPAMANKENSAATDEDGPETADFENPSQGRSLTRFSQVTSRSGINEY